MRIAEDVQELAPTEKAQYYKQKWDEANVQMEVGERAVQMIKHEPFYFITNHGRVFSVHQKKCRELKQGNTKTAKSQGDTEHLSVTLCVNKKPIHHRVGCLVAEYFDVSEFNPMGEPDIEVHHKQAYEVEKGRFNNFEGNLQKTGAKVHRSIFASIQNATLTDEGLQLKNPKRFYKSMNKIHETNPDAAFMVLSCINEDNTVKSVEGRMLTDQDLKELFGNKQIQEMLQAASAYCMEQELGRRRAMAKYIREHPERVRIVNGEPVIINEEEKENGLEKKQKKEARA